MYFTEKTHLKLYLLLHKGSRYMYRFLYHLRNAFDSVNSNLL